MCEGSLGDEVVGVSVGELGERVRRQRRNDEQIGAREVNVEIVSRRAARKREKGLCANKSLRPGRDERHDFVAPLDEQANQLAGLVSSNAPGNSDENASHAGNSAFRTPDPRIPPKPEAKAGEAALAAGELMRGGDAKPRRAAQRETSADHQEARGLRPRAFPAQRRL